MYKPSYFNKTVNYSLTYKVNFDLILYQRYTILINIKVKKSNSVIHKSQRSFLNQMSHQ